MTPPRIVACQGEDCDASVVQQPGTRRLFCDACRRARKRATGRAWKRAHPDLLARYQRERRQRRRIPTRTENRQP